MLSSVNSELKDNTKQKQKNDKENKTIEEEEEDDRMDTSIQL